MSKKYYGSVLLLSFLMNAVMGYAQLHHELSMRKRDTLEVDSLMNAAGLLRPANVDGAINLLNEALHISKSLHFDNGIAGSLMSIAFCYQDKGEYKKSKELLFLAYPFCIKASSSNKRILPSLYNGLGGTYSFMGQNDSAIHFFYEALEEIKKNKYKDSFTLAQIYNNLGTAWMQQKEIEKGIYYQKQAAMLARKIGNELFMADVYCNLGVAYLEQKDSILALQYLESALQIFLKKKSSKGLQFVYYAMGTAQGDQQKAIAFYNASLEYDRNSAFAAGIYQGIGKAYYLSGDYNKAERYYQQSEMICREQGLLTHRLANYSALSSIYGLTGRYQLAYEYQVDYANLNDSLLNTEKLKAINQLEVKYRTAEKDRELAENKVQLYRQQRKTGFMMIGILLLVGLGLGVWYYSRQKQKLQAALIRNFDQQQKMDHLHAKMQGEEEERSRIARELHDGVNVLLSATKMNYAALGKEYRELPGSLAYQEIMQLLNNIGIELRTITYKLVPELLIQQSLPDAVETFCELIQKGNSLNIEVQTYGSFSALPAEFCFAIYRIIQELTHNIVKHAGATQVLIVLSYQDDLLHLTVEDNGGGFFIERPMNGLGLKSIRSRVKDLNGEVTFTSQPGIGTSVEIEIITKITEQK